MPLDVILHMYILIFCRSITLTREPC